MRSVPLILLAAASLLAPALAFAASPTPTARYFEIQGLVIGDQKVEASGKLGIEGTKLYASVGCNTIGGEVELDGDTVTIVGPTSTTEMACPGSSSVAEDTLVKILGLGAFTITAGSWDADGGQILTVEVPVTAPVPNASAPDEPVSSSPGAVIVDPAFTCPPTPSGVNGGTTPGSGPGAVSGSGGGSPGSGGNSSSSGSTGTGTASPGTVTVDPGGTSVDPAPPAPVPADSPSLGQTEPEPSVAIAPAPDQTASDLPLPVGSDPSIGKPPVDGPCYEGLDAGFNGQGSGGAVPPKAAETVADHAPREAAGTNGWVIAVAFAGLFLVVVAESTLRRRATPR
jgi:heat shock protein HslJ